MAEHKRLYAQITKTEELDDGTVKVWGYASTPDEDSDGEIITADAMKAALPDYLKFGAVREMHSNKAAGTAIEADVQADGRTWFGAHVVDNEAVKKVKAKVYKGFSVGGTITSRDDVNKSTITGINLVEVSLVDRPANPEAVFTMYKADGLDNADDEKAAIAAIVKLVNSGIKPSEILNKLTADQGKKVEKAIMKNQPEDIEKAGARHSKADAERLQNIHDNAAAMGADCPGADKAANSGDLAKIQLTDALAKVEKLTEDLAKAAENIETLTKRVKELEAEPAAPKAVLKAVDKSADVAIAAPEIEPIHKNDGSIDDAATLIKKIQATGGRCVVL